jgi:nucleotide-binding universal stress UspA family protein
MAKEYVGAPFAAVCGVVFGLLLISAVNTAVADMVSIQYVMSRDTELPKALMKLNIFGVPWRTLVAAVALPSGILLITGDLDMLAGLYAIGVVGAIAINLGSCCMNKQMPLKLYERIGMGVLCSIMIAIELTLSVEKPSALLFAGGVLAVGLGSRLFTKWYLPARARMKVAPTKEELTTGRYRGAEIHAETKTETPPISTDLATLGTPSDQLDMNRPKVLVAIRGGRRLIEFATRYAVQTNGTLFVLFVRQINVIAAGPAPSMSLNDDEEAKTVFKMAAEECKKAGVPMVPMYVTSPDVAYAILDFAATYSVSALLMGVSRQGALLRALKGDVLAAVADHLPEDIPMLIHA